MKKILLTAVAGLLLSAGAAYAQVYVRVGPPPPVVERPIPAPGRGYAWIAGYHRWDGHRYIWAPGRWVVPPRPRAEWVPGHWDSRPRGYIWVPGRWR